MLNIRPLSTELQERAKQELNEVPSRLQADINHIRNWLAQQSHIRARTDDQWIVNFLRGCKFSLERTKEKLDMFYTTRSLMPAYFTNRDPFLPDIQRILNLGLLLPLPKTVGDDGARIILVRYGNFDTRIPFTTLLKTFLMIIDILLYEDDNYVIGGQHAWGDLAGSSLEYLLTINLNEMKKVVIYLETAYPSRPQAFDVINAPAIYETLLGMIRALLSEKVKDRLHIYSTCNTEKLYKIIPCAYLPKEYGGECSSIPELTAYWKKKVESYKDWLLEEDRYGVDETKRPGKPKTSEELFGIEGSFRKLDLD